MQRQSTGSLRKPPQRRLVRQGRRSSRHRHGRRAGLRRRDEAADPGGRRRAHRGRALQDLRLRLGHRLVVPGDRVGQGQDARRGRQHQEHADRAGAFAAAGQDPLLDPGRGRNQGRGRGLQEKALVNRWRSRSPKKPPATCSPFSPREARAWVCAWACAPPAARDSPTSWNSSTRRSPRTSSSRATASRCWWTPRACSTSTARCLTTRARASTKASSSPTPTSRTSAAAGKASTSSRLQSHFDLFGLDPRYALETEKLEQAYRDIQARVHPDRYAQSGDAERRASLQLTTRVNEAYRTLKDPVQRAKHILDLNGVDVAFETNTQMPSDFLLKQLEWREELEEAVQTRNADRLDAMRKRLSLEGKAIQADIETLIDGICVLVSKAT